MIIEPNSEYTEKIYILNIAVKKEKIIDAIIKIYNIYSYMEYLKN